MDFELIMSILLGVVFGGVQFWLLKIGVGSVVKGKIKVWPFVVQFLCPLAGLLLCAFVWRDQLVAVSYTHLNEEGKLLSMNVWTDEAVQSIF